MCGILLWQPKQTNTSTTEAVLAFGHRWETEDGCVWIQSSGYDYLKRALPFPSRYPVGPSVRGIS